MLNDRQKEKLDYLKKGQAKFKSMYTTQIRGMSAKDLAQGYRAVKGAQIAKTILKTASAMSLLPLGVIGGGAAAILNLSKTKTIISSY